MPSVEKWWMGGYTQNGGSTQNGGNTQNGGS